MIFRYYFILIGLVALSFFFFACGEDSGNNAEADSLLETSSCSWQQEVSSDAKSEKYSSSSFVDKTTTNEDGSITDGRDGLTYKTVQIGSQIWMAENLNFHKNISALCFNNDSQNCDYYGRLYSWAVAMDSAGVFSTDGIGCGNECLCEPISPVRGICPKGWHLPSESEFKTLLNYVGYDVAAKKLKSSERWPNLANGTNNYGFSALPAGEYVLGFKFDNIEKRTFFWIAEEDHGSWGKILEIDYDYDKALLTRTFKNSAVSIRCLKDTIISSSSFKTTLIKSSSSSLNKNDSSSSGERSSSSIRQSSSSIVTKNSSSSSLKQSSSSMIPSSSSYIKVIEEPSSSSMEDWNWNIPTEARFNPDIAYDSIIDERDQQVYRTVTIGTQTWMAENLNYKGPEAWFNAQSWCYDDVKENCKVTGRLYDWSSNITYCPAGWHLPTEDEWRSLMQFVSDSVYVRDSKYIVYSMAESRLKTTSGWLVGNGSDDFGFSMIPAGVSYQYSAKEYFGSVGERTSFWTSTKVRSGDSWGPACWSFGGAEDVVKSVSATNCGGSIGIGKSVRCIKD